jgi:hypothetical protein
MIDPFMNPVAKFLQNYVQSRVERNKLGNQYCKRCLRKYTKTFAAVLRIRIRIRIHVFLGLPDPELWIQILLWIRILLSCKNSKKNLDSYYLMNLFDFLSLKNDVNVASKKVIGRKN